VSDEVKDALLFDGSPPRRDGNEFLAGLARSVDGESEKVRRRFRAPRA
jgi:hypothetical protein